jgi:hypothetical protein
MYRPNYVYNLCMHNVHYVMYNATTVSVAHASYRPCFVKRD